MKLISLRLVLDVDFDPQGMTAPELKQNLYRVVYDAVNNGTLSGDGPATVERYCYRVTQRHHLKRYSKASVIANARKRNTKANARKLALVDSGGYKISKP